MWTAAIRAFCLSLVLGGCIGEKMDADTGATVITFSDSERERILDHGALESIPANTTNAVADHPAAAHLGQFLFFDERLSGSGEHSCATCHLPEHGFSDEHDLSEAAGTTTRHTPSILNAVYNNWQFWDGRCDTFWCQATGPLEATNEQDTDRLAIAHLVHGNTALSTAYTSLFGDLPDLEDNARFPPHARPMPDDPTHPDHTAWIGMTEEDQVAITWVFTNVTKAIGAYERRLVRGDAPYDTFVQGLLENDPDKIDAISDEAKAGLKLFVGEGNCFACHSGPVFTNLEFHNVALPPMDGIENDSLGRYEGIQKLLDSPFNGEGAYSDDPEGVRIKLDHLVVSPEQEGQFKTPTLRNLLSTAPYMHGGHFSTLTEVVQHYSEMDDPVLVGHREELLLPRGWSDAQIASVVAFLETLEGAPLDTALMVQPESPVLD